MEHTKTARIGATPSRLRGLTLAQLLDWYLINLRGVELLDPQGNEIVFDKSRFPYLIKLTRTSGQKLAKPLRKAERIEQDEVDERDFGDYDPDRAETLSWLPDVVRNPKNIRRNTSHKIPADVVYVKEYQISGRRFKLLYCNWIGASALVPITSFRVKREPDGDVLWPTESKKEPNE